MTTSVAELLRSATSRLASAAEARTLLAHACGCQVTGLFTLDRVSEEDAERFGLLVDRRADGVPLQHLTGVAHFRTISVAVGPGVFIPRPETEVMVGWALERLASRRTTGGEPVRVVELCSGSGVISKAIAAELPGCEQYAVELSPPAMEYATANLAGTGVQVVEGDMATALPELDGTVDLVIANPPYIPLDAYEGVPAEVRDFDPAVALFSGADGLDALRVVARVARRLLRPGGWVCAEHAEVQAESAVDVFIEADGFEAIADHVDLTGRPRFVTARRVSLAGGRAGRITP